MQQGTESRPIDNRFSPLSTVFAGRCLSEHERFCNLIDSALDSATPSTTLRNNGRLRGLVDVAEERIRAIEAFVAEHLRIYGDFDIERIELFEKTVLTLEGAVARAKALDDRAAFSSKNMNEKKTLRLASEKASSLASKYQSCKEAPIEVPAVGEAPRSIPHSKLGALSPRKDGSGTPTIIRSGNAKGATGAFAQANGANGVANGSASSPPVSNNSTMASGAGGSSPSPSPYSSRQTSLNLTAEYSPNPKSASRGGKAGSNGAGKATAHTKPAAAATPTTATNGEPSKEQKLTLQLLAMEEEKARMNNVLDFQDTLHQLQTLFDHFRQAVVKTTPSSRSGSSSNEKPSRVAAAAAAATSSTKGAIVSGASKIKGAVEVDQTASIGTPRHIGLGILLGFIFGTLFGAILLPLLLQGYSAKGYLEL